MISKNNQSKSDADNNDTPQADNLDVADAAIDEPQSMEADADTPPGSTCAVGEVNVMNDDTGKADEADTHQPENTTASNDQAEGEKTPDQLQGRIAELEDELLRSQAEMENIRKRALRNIDRNKKSALEHFIKALLPTIESLAKAQGSLGESEQQSAENSHQTEGVALCLKLLLDTLGKFGVEEINPLGEPFDPNLQEAMAMIPQPETEPNTVVEVLEIGYTLNKRLIRAAKVIVSSSALTSTSTST